MRSFSHLCLPKWRVAFFLPALAFVLASDVSSGAETARLMVRVFDKETGRPIPARLALQTSDGAWPGDRLACSAAQWPHREAHAIFIPGEETFTLPAGKTFIAAAHGLEYVAESRTLDLQPNQTATAEFRLRRAVAMRQAGWVSGDLHVHMIHGEQQRTTSYEDVALSCAANGLGFVSVGQEWVGAGTLDLAGYQAACRKVSTPDFQMFLGAERPKNLLGHQVLLGVENPFVISDEAPYFLSATKIHQHGGVAVYVHPVRYYPGKQYGGEWLDFPGNNLARELIFDAFAGPSFDGLSVLSDEPGNESAHRLWFNLLNRGCFTPVFADSDACFDRPTLGLKAPGFWSTYFYLGPGAEVTPTALAVAVRRGRTMATTGPLLQFRVAGEISGATLPLDGKPRQVEIDVDYPQHAFSLATVDAQTQLPVVVSRVELIRNGQVVKTWEPNTTAARVSHTVAETTPCWYAVRAYGSDRQWQVALASPIYFASEPTPAKREPFSTLVRGRIYDFATGEERSAAVEIRRGGAVLQQFQASGRFEAQMPIDAELIVEAKGAPPLPENLLMDHGPVHRFLWYLESEGLGRAETFEQFERLVRVVDWEFPVGYRMPGCYFARDLERPLSFDGVRILDGPESVTGGAVAVAAVLLDAQRIAPGDTLHVAAIFRDEGSAAKDSPLTVEARGYDPSRPTGFGALKKFDSVESTWDTATDLGKGYKLISGELDVPDWVASGPTGAIDLSVRARRGNGDAAFIGLAIPLGPTQRTLSLTSSWPTMPISWPDRSYGIGPLKVCNRVGRAGRPRADYRQLHLSVAANGATLDLLPARDGRGCEDADDAFYTGHYLDQTLSEESHLAQPDPIRPQPASNRSM